MPLYTYECSACGNVRQEVFTFEQHVNRFMHGSCSARGWYLQVYDFHFNKGMREHWSSQLNRPVSNEREFNSELSRQSDEYSARMGYDVKFETADPTDPKAMGVTDDV